MLRIFTDILEIIIMFILQSSVFSYFRVGGVVPDCMLILIISVAYIKGQNRAIITAFISGMLLDLCFFDFFGITSLIYMLIAYFAGISSKYYRENDFIMPAMLIICGEFIFGILTYVTGFLLIGKTAFGLYLINTIIPRMIYTIVTAIVLYPLLLFINNLIKRTE